MQSKRRYTPEDLKRAKEIIDRWEDRNHAISSSSRKDLVMTLAKVMYRERVSFIKKLKRNIQELRDGKKKEKEGKPRL
jgi:hypothetical protein